MRAREERYLLHAGRMIPTRIHGILDYATALLLLLAPWLFDFYRSAPATWVPVVLAAGALIYSVFTDYEAGVVKQLPMPVHLGLDAGSGVLLAASPWLFGFAGSVWEPHVVIGLFEIVVAALTRRTPSYRRSSARA